MIYLYKVEELVFVLLNLMLKDRLLNLKLPNRVSGNYSITYNNIVYISVEGEDGVWKIRSNKNVKILSLTLLGK